MKQIQAYPGIHFEINSVFSPQTISYLSESMRFIIEKGGPDITFNISTMEEWDPVHLETLEKELTRLTDFLVLLYKKKGIIPVKNFRFNGEKKKSKREIFQCAAGRYRMAVTPEGKVWGCFLFHDYFKTRENHPPSQHRDYADYAFGTLTDFIANYETRYPGVLANYSQLRQDYFQVEGEGTNFCFLCRDVEACMVCPVNAAYTSGSLGKISCGKCRLIKMQINARRNFNLYASPQQF